MASPKPVYFRDVDFSALNFPAIGKEIRTKGRVGGTEAASSGAVSTLTVYNITYGASKQPLLVRFPTSLSTIGLRKNMGDKWTIPLTFTTVDAYGVKPYGDAPHETAELDAYYPQGQLYNFFKTFETTLKAAVRKNSNAWLNAASLSEKRVDELFNPVVKPHTDRVLGAATGKYPPTVSLEVNASAADTFDLSLRDVDKVVVVPKMETVTTMLRGGVHMRGVLAFNGLFYSNNKFTATFTLMYAEIMKPLNGVARPTATSMTFDVLEDTEEEKTAEAVSKRARGDTARDAGPTDFSSVSFLEKTRPGRGRSATAHMGAGAGSASESH